MVEDMEPIEIEIPLEFFYEKYKKGKIKYMDYMVAKKRKEQGRPFTTTIYKPKKTEDTSTLTKEVETQQ